MEKKLVTWLTTLVVVVALAVVLGAAFWRAPYESGSEPNGHQHDHSRSFFQKKLNCS